MQFRALHDDRWVYCYFGVQDNNILTYVNESKKEEVLYGDRVEIFFAADDDLRSYYCLEIDPNARVYDYVASHYRRFDAAWQWPSGQLRIETNKSENGYEVAMAIGKESLTNLELIQNQRIRAGIFRGKCMEINFNQDRMQWISWVPPQSPFPDFHVPSAFGALILE